MDYKERRLLFDMSNSNITLEQLNEFIERSKKYGDVMWGESNGYMDLDMVTLSNASHCVDEIEIIGNCVYGRIRFIKNDDGLPKILKIKNNIDKKLRLYKQPIITYDIIPRIANDRLITFDIDIKKVGF